MKLEIETKMKIFDDNGINIHNKLCAFLISYEIERHPLDGVYGVSGAEMNRKDIYKVTNYMKIFGIYDENTNIITQPNGKEIDLSSYYTLCKVKILNINEILI